MKQTRETADHRKQVEDDMDTMRAAVRKTQQASLARGVPIAYLIDGVMHYELPSGEITRTSPAQSSPPVDTSGQ